ncbi:MAG: hypothetical protein N4J56_002582 [Chroococcidiopsis sp. SAG 2025]|uniref:hypothetical protein n=1 Tax=Chroococcidiopsis sp. SAG 2025 TaxID=171389 RepID=UPI002937230C|nr:hypothetical protein [Chroococcidiopsis sp. SAG 2025]MDV2992928.1 hypothetical protein [Chroococcidiopsis sp. SAG 2025]
MTAFELEHSIDTNMELSSISTSQEVETLREQVEFLREQMESLHRLVEHLGAELLDKHQQIHALEQELEQTNKELCRALAPQQQEITPAKDYQSKALDLQVSVSESLAALFNATSGRAIPAKKLEVEEAIANTATLPNMVAQQILNDSKELKAHSQQLNFQCKELGFQFIANQANFMKSQEEVAWKLTELPQQFGKETIMSQRLQASRTKTEANVRQLQEHVERTRKLSNKSKVYVKLVKSRSASYSDSTTSAKLDLTW